MSNVVLISNHNQHDDKYNDYADDEKNYFTVFFSISI